jgi:hypothetical protein
MKSLQDITRIVRETANLIISNDFEESLRFSTAKEGFYGLLCIKLDEIYTSNQANRLKKAYERNSWNYNNLVDDILKNSSSDRCEVFKFSNSEWEKINADYSSKKIARKELLIGFHDILAQKLQERGKRVTFLSKKQ